jgi:hypothetical protein
MAGEEVPREQGLVLWGFAGLAKSFAFFCFVLFVWQDWGLNLGLCTFKAVSHSTA